MYGAILITGNFVVEYANSYYDFTMAAIKKSNILTKEARNNAGQHPAYEHKFLNQHRMKYLFCNNNGRESLICQE